MKQIIQDEYPDSKIFPGTCRPFSIFIPEEYDPAKPAALLVTTDIMDFSDIMDELIKKKKMPVCIGLFTRTGYHVPLREGAVVRESRSQEYDGLGSGYADFVVDELIPYVKKKYKLNLTDDPDLCLASGCSSGGIAAWNMAWERNDVFHRVLIFSPTFCAFHGGDAFPAMMRKYETKKIRCYMVAGTEDMRNSAGDWHLEALRADKAMDYAGYDYSFLLVQDGKHGCGFREHDFMEKGLTWCWRNWETEKIRPLHFSPRVSDMISMDSEWEPFDGVMPEKNKLPETIVPADTLKQFPAYAIAPDRARIYITDPARRFLYSWDIKQDGTLTGFEKFGHLDLPDDFTSPGAADVETDIQDRVYAATELGIQTFSSQSEHNCILPLPGKRAVKKIVLTAGETPYMYAECADGRIFRRRWLVSGLTENTPVTAPSTEAF